MKRIGLKINELLQKGNAGKEEYYCFRKGDFGFTFLVMDIGTKQEVHSFIQAVSLNEIKKNKSRNWLTIAHFLESNSLIGTLTFVSGRY